VHVDSDMHKDATGRDMHDLQRYLIMQMWASEPGRDREKRLLKKPAHISEKLALEADSKEIEYDYDKDMTKKAKSAVLKFGGVSIPYLMRKLKCDSSYANEVMGEI